jgi:DNA-binding transcriptional LysR family regulator
MFEPRDLTGVSAFVVLAEARSFRVAAERLGVTRSAVSHALRRLEERIGVALVERTTRSVRLTEAGESLCERARPALADVDAALEDAAARRRRPSGMLRLSVSSIAESFLDGAMLAGFVAAYPDIKLDITVSDDEDDVFAKGFDAGVRLGELIDKDLIAVPVSARQRQIVVAAPSYLRARGTPKHPRELVEHACIGWRRQPDLAPYRWEFTERGRDFDVAVQPHVTTNDMALKVKLARAGAGFVCGMQETFQPYLDSGELVAVLERFCPPFAGFYLYYPKAPRAAPKLRALIDHVRSRR